MFLFHYQIISGPRQAFGPVFPAPGERADP
ncbi:hypothetical protein CCP2SC5_410008 [Azospirillaceae bacterium]